MRRSFGIAAAVVVVLATGGMTATAQADTSTATSSTATGGTTAPSAKDWADRLEKVCARVDRSVKRAEKVQARLSADAKSRGSIAFLQARVDRAKQAGQDDLAEVLGLRLQARQQIATQLPVRLDLLEQAQQTCAEPGK